MNAKNTIPTLILAAATVAACSPPETAPPAAPSSSAAAAPGGAVAAYWQRALAEAREAEAAALARGILPQLNVDLALAARKDGTPFVFTREAGSSCGTLLLPNGSYWDLTGGGTLTVDGTVTDAVTTYRGALPGRSCRDGAATYPSRFDAAAANSANAAGKPWAWRINYTDGRVCQPLVQVAGVQYFLPLLPLTERGTPLWPTTVGTRTCDGLVLGGKK